jgi:hypothetical protein
MRCLMKAVSTPIGGNMDELNDDHKDEVALEPSEALAATQEEVPEDIAPVGDEPPAAEQSAS